jgi:hypothetical protein
MPFAYYDRLSEGDKAVYRRSDEVTTVELTDPVRLVPLVAGLREALARDDRRAVEVAAGHLAQGVLRTLGLKPVILEVLAARPSSRWGELHGLYTRDGDRPPRIQLWMRTARHRRVVAFRTFLRTLLHELGHHLDYEYLRLEESFHTEGFFRRESSLVRQLLPEARPAAAISQGSDEPPLPGRK